jgi:FixJ family two-component response regulator
MSENLSAVKQIRNSELGCVYITEDDDGMRNSIQTALTLLGYKVSAYKNPLDFLALDVLDAPAVLITDMRMPDISGIDLQEALAKRGNHIPIIYVSGQSTLEQCLRAMKQGALDFLLKPFSREDLIKAVVKGMDADLKD